MSTLHIAARNGDLETVRRMVAANPASVDADDEHDWRPVFHAALCRHTDVVRFLIEAGADLSAHEGYVLHYGGEVPDNKAVVELLIRYGALDAHVHPPNDLVRQFLAALFLADQERVQSPLTLHARLATAVDGRGDQPIHHAARNGDTEIVQLLINHGADVNVASQRGNTVLYCAAGHGHLATVMLLLEHGVKVNARFFPGGKTVPEWLTQFPDDTRFGQVSQVLEQHQSDIG